MEKMQFLRPEDFAFELSNIFADLKSKVLEILPYSDVEHVGSSSIVGAISKGDLDILVRVDGAALETAVDKIKMLGFSVKEDTFRNENLCMLTSDNYRRDVAIQVIAKGSNFENFVAFRDLLNKNPELVLDYNLLKESCVGMSSCDYRARKSKFIENVLNSCPM